MLFLQTLLESNVNEVVRIKRNYVFSVLSISSRLIANVIVFWMMARFYSLESFGQITFAHTLATTFILLADFGFDILLTNELARSRENGRELFQKYFSLKLIFTFLSFMIMCSFVFLSDVNIEMRILSLIFSLYMVFTTQSNFIFAFFRGYEKFNYESVISLLMNMGLLVLVITMVLFKSNTIFIAVGFAASRFAGFIIGVLYSYRIIPDLSYKPMFKGLTEIRSKVFVYGFHFLFSYLFFQLDTILLALWKNEYEVGIYQAVYKLIMLPLVIPDIFANSLLPSLSKYYVEENRKWRTIGKLMSKSLLIIILPAFLVLQCYPTEVIEFIYGSKDYFAAVQIMEVFSLTLLVRFLLEPFALMITTSNHQSIRLYTVIAATLLNFTLNLFAIPQYGAYGAAIVSLITNSFVALIYFGASWSLFKDWIFDWKTILLLLLLPLTVFFLKHFVKNSIWEALPILVFLMVAAGYFYFSQQERKWILTNNYSLLLQKK